MFLGYGARGRFEAQKLHCGLKAGSKRTLRSGQSLILMNCSPLRRFPLVWPDGPDGEQQTETAPSIGGQIIWPVLRSYKARLTRNDNHN